MYKHPQTYTRPRSVLSQSYKSPETPTMLLLWYGSSIRGIMWQTTQTLNTSLRTSEFSFLWKSFHWPYTSFEACWDKDWMRIFEILPLWSGAGFLIAIRRSFGEEKSSWRRGWTWGPFSLRILSPWGCRSFPSYKGWYSAWKWQQELTESLTLCLYHVILMPSHAIEKVLQVEIHTWILNDEFITRPKLESSLTRVRNEQFIKPIPFLSGSYTTFSRLPGVYCGNSTAFGSMQYKKCPPEPCHDGPTVLLYDCCSCLLSPRKVGGWKRRDLGA